MASLAKCFLLSKNEKKKIFKTTERAETRKLVTTIKMVKGKLKKLKQKKHKCILTVGFFLVTCIQKAVNFHCF